MNNSDANEESDHKFSVPKSTKVKKKIIEFDDVALVDTEDELNHKKKLREYMQNLDMENEEKKRKIKKKKDKRRESLDDASLLDTDNERKHKSVMKEHMNESEFTLLGQIKSEPESEVEGNVVKKKSKKKKK